MYSRRRRILLSEIARQCNFAMIAYGDSTAALQRADAERLWYSLEGLVSASTRLHSLLWPAIEDSEAAAEFRRSLSIAEDSPLHRADWREMANLIATLDSWSALGPSQPPLLTNFGPNGFTEPSPAECVRCFAPQSGSFTLYGRIIELPALLHECVKIRQCAEEELSRLRAMV